VLPGAVAAATWAVGLVVGVLAIATGHAVLAIATLVLAVAAPWVGLAWVSRSRRRAYQVALYLHGSQADGLADLPTCP
jgi:hypothetical protein